MADEIRKPLLNRTAALLAGPFLLGQRALGLVFQQEAPPGPAPRLTVTPPEHAIKRRG